LIALGEPMKLELKPAVATESLIKGKRRLERGEMTIGRDPDCTLVITDETRMVSKTHCRILCVGRGFLLRDESVNGVSLTGRELAEGETVRLADGDEISFCGHVLRVCISGDDEPDWSDPDSRLAVSDEAPSITTILADVSPGGLGANGLLPGRVGEDWMQTQASAGRRHPLETLPGAEIGWNGPPPVSMLGSPLPQDWDDVSDAGGGNEHVLATSIRVSLPRTSAWQAAEGSPPPPQQEKDDERLLNAFLQGYGAALEPVGDTRLFMHRMGHALRQLVEYGNRIAAQTRDFALGEGVEWPGRTINPLDPRPGMETAERDHRRLLEAVSWLLDETDRLAPATVAARAVRPQAATILLELLRETAAMLGQEGRAWRSYGVAYFADGVSPRGRFKARLAASEDLDAFEELKPDGVSPSDASRSDA
jgi:type VI secretion system protein ImpI